MLTGKRWQISTHAPTQGATQQNDQINQKTQISTHAPTQGATGLFFCWMKYRLFQLTRPRKARQAELATWQQKANFNSRAHARRNISVTNRTQRLVISTHAPTQGATINHHQPPCNSRISTHAPTQGATNNAGKELLIEEFQLTRPRKARRRATGTTKN